LRAAGARVILADSYSEDGTLQIAHGFVDETRSIEPGNMYRAINSALEHEISEWVTYVNSDDILFAPSISQALACAQDDDDLIYGDIDYIDEQGAFLHSWTTPRPAALWPLFSGPFMPIPQPGTMIRAAVFKDLGGFDTNFRYSADYDFFLRAAAHGHRFRRYPSRLAAFRVHSSQISSNHAQQMRLECEQAVRRVKGRGSRMAYCIALLRLRVQNWHSYSIRCLRCRQLTGTFRLTRTIEVIN
jgi:glycosyltransferase involved in cell wall biosynthesis